MLNPKVALFFLSLLPQYVATDAQHTALTFFVLGLSFVLTSTLWSLGIVYGAALFSGLFTKSEWTQKYANKIAGCIYIGLGFHLLRATASSK